MYLLAPFKIRRHLILLASIVFYMAFIPKYLFVIVTLILVDYGAGMLIEKSKRKGGLQLLIISLSLNISLLAFFKYFNFMSANISAFAQLLGWDYSTKFLSVILPLGLSFHTFQSMAYLIEVYRKKMSAEKNLLTYSLYVIFFPQLVAGPIGRPQHLLPQLRKLQEYNWEYVREGLQLMLWGYFQKVVIADRLALFVDPVYNNPQGYYGFSLVIAILFFAFQIYCDFAGYTNIARGVAKIFGVNLSINFNKPYFAISVGDFWRRWHISLSSWFRDYLYIPIGGNRKGFLRNCLNILTVFAITGLWHGASWTFIVWGAFHGIFITFELLLKKAGVVIIRPVAISITFIFVCFSWIFFRASNLGDAAYIISHIFTFKSLRVQDIFLVWNRNDFLIAVSLIIFLIIVEYTGNDIKILLVKNAALRWTAYYIAIFSILLLGVFSQSKFIYFQF